MAQNFRKNIFFGLLIALAFSSTNCDVDIKVVLEQPITVPVSDVVATSLVLTFAPGEEGSPPHHHAGPVTGYVLEGSFLFQVGDESPRIIPAGGTFYEADCATHVWGANASDKSTCKVLVTVYGRPGEPILTLVEGVKRNSRAEALALATSKA